MPVAVAPVVPRVAGERAIEVELRRGGHRGQAALADGRVDGPVVMRQWQANGLKPHLVHGFKIPRDPKFVEKLEDIVGPYISPPEHALARWYCAATRRAKCRRWTARSPECR